MGVRAGIVEVAVGCRSSVNRDAILSGTVCRATRSPRQALPVAPSSPRAGSVGRDARRSHGYLGQRRSSRSPSRNGWLPHTRRRARSLLRTVCHFGRRGFVSAAPHAVRRGSCSSWGTRPLPCLLMIGLADRLQTQDPPEIRRLSLFPENGASGKRMPSAASPPKGLRRRSPQRFLKRISKKRSVRTNDVGWANRNSKISGKARLEKLLGGTKWSCRRTGK